MKILIAGLAKTGTTGMLYLIANSFRKKPTLLFEPKTCPPETATSSADVVAKVLISKELDAASFAHFDKKITIVRDPRDRMISALLYSQFHANYVRDDEKVGFVHEWLKKKEADPSSVSLVEIFRVLGQAAGKTKNMKNIGKAGLGLFDDYVAAIPDALLYKYEDFVSGQYVPIERHLGMPMAGQAEVPDHLNRVVRTKGYGNWRNWMTREDVEIFRPLLSPWLEKYGYDASDWQLNDQQVIDPAHCSDYFMRVVEEARKKPVPAATHAANTDPDRGQVESHKPEEAGAAKRKISRTLTGNVVKAEPGVVAGWAIGSNPERPVGVELWVNGNLVATMLADNPRPAFKANGIHPTGLCGFAFRLKQKNHLKAGDEVLIKPVGEALNLLNNPRIVSIPTMNLTTDE